MDEEKISVYADLMLSEGLNLDLEDPQLKDTPKRIAKSYRELFKGLEESGPGITTFPNNLQSNDIIMSDCIPFTSMCAHHLLPFFGHCWILYIPLLGNSRVIGFSKFARIVGHFAARPQTQEALVQQVADYIMDKAEPEGVMVFSRAKHTCAMCRGVKSGPTNGLTTSTVRGVFKDKPTLEPKGLEMIKISLMMEGGL